jgi:Cu+-exporting ATPase
MCSRKGNITMETQDMQGAQASPAIDPVCGMQVDPATAAGSSEYQGQTYYFCSLGCKRQFDKDPESHLSAQDAEEQR